MASMLWLLEAREASARERVEVLREEAARAVAALETGEIELDRRVIAREELVEALAVSAAETTGVTEAEGEGETALVPAPASAAEPGAIVPHWQEGLSVSVLSPNNQRILNVLQDRPGLEPVRAKDIAAALGIEAAAKVEECGRRVNAWPSGAGCSKKRRARSVPAAGSWPRQAATHPRDH
ncbi:hypothetical protein ACFQ2H_40375 [Streptomyces violaceoruber]